MNKVKLLAITGTLTALTVIVTFFTRIPLSLTQGYFNLGDVVVFVAAVTLGSYRGAVVGAVGSALADIFAGSLVFAPITLVVKGLAGVATGKMCKRLHDDGGIRHTAALCVGAAIVVAGYFLAEATLLSLYDSAFGLSAAITELPVNLVQCVISAILARIVIAGLVRSKRI